MLPEDVASLLFSTNLAEISFAELKASLNFCASVENNTNLKTKNYKV